MSSRTRFALILGLTILVVSGAVGFMIARAQRWHRRGWAGVNIIAGFNAEQQSRMMGQKQNAVMMTVAGGPADGRLLFGDEVVSIGGVPLTDLKALRALDRRVQTGAVVVYRVKRGDRVFDVPLRFASPWRTRVVIIHHLVALAVGLTFIAIGLIVMLRARDDRRAVVFYTLALLTAVAVMGKAATVYEQSNCRGFIMEPLSILMSVVFYGILSLTFLPLILHLALIFPRSRPIVQTRPYVIRWIYAVALTSVLVVVFLVISGATLLAQDRQTAIKQLDRVLEPAGYAFLAFSLLVAAHLLYAARREGVGRAILTRPFRVSIAVLGAIGALARVMGAIGWKVPAAILAFTTTFLPFLVLLSFPLFALAALYRSYREANVEEKRQVTWPLWGLLAAIGGKVLALIASAALGTWITLTHRNLIDWRGPIEFLDTVPTLFTLLIPVTFAIAILKYRLMNIDVILRKTVVYAILSGLIVVLYLGLVGGLGTVLVNFAGVRNQTMVITATLIVAAAFVPMRNKLQTLVERNLFRHRFAYPDALKAVSAEALVASDAGAFLASVAEKTQQALQSRAVLIFGARHDEFVASAKVGVADSLLGALRVARAPILPLLDRPFDPRIHPLPDDAAAALRHIEAVLVVPVNTPGTPANGFIAVGSKLSRAPYEIEDVEFLRAVADQLDVGLDRIRQQREDADYSQARTIQQSLLPRDMPRLEGLDVSGVWLPARTMGGDYFDVIELGPTQLAVCIGDVAGKGMPAALLMSGLQAAVRASASDSPRDVCERVRRVVVSSLTGGRFVTFFYATLDTVAMRLRWTNAGHNAPVLARADGSIVRLTEGGPAISRLFRTTAYEEREMALLPGDRLVLFTDGVSEAGDTSGEQFGEQRIEEIAASAHGSAATLQQAIVNAATSFAREIEDDLTLVVVQLTPPA